MKTDDRFLIGITLGIVVLVVAALVVVRMRPAPEYMDEDTPEAAAHNYLLALQREDWARAHAGLAPTLACYPATVEVFFDDLSAQPYQRDFDNVTLRVESSTVEGDSAIVTVRQTRFQTGGLFSSGQYTQDFEMSLNRVDGTWRVTRSDQHWLWFWHDPSEQSCDEMRRSMTPRIFP